MTDFLSWGASWLGEMSDEHASFLVECSWTDGASDETETLRASVVDEEGTIIRADVKARVENTRFMFNTDEVSEKNVPLMRGLRINWDGALYEVVIQGSRSYWYNDTYRQKVVVVTKHVPN